MVATVRDIAHNETFPGTYTFPVTVNASIPSSAQVGDELLIVASYIENRSGTGSSYTTTLSSSLGAQISSVIQTDQYGPAGVKHFRYIVQSGDAGSTVTITYNGDTYGVRCEILAIFIAVIIGNDTSSAPQVSTRSILTGYDNYGQDFAWAAVTPTASDTLQIRGSAIAEITFNSGSGRPTFASSDFPNTQTSGITSLYAVTSGALYYYTGIGVGYKQLSGTPDIPSQSPANVTGFYSNFNLVPWDVFYTPASALPPPPPPPPPSSSGYIGDMWSGAPLGYRVLGDASFPVIKYPESFAYFF